MCVQIYICIYYIILIILVAVPRYSRRDVIQASCHRIESHIHFYLNPPPLISDTGSPLSSPALTQDSFSSHPEEGMGESNLVYALAGSVGFLGAGWGRADIPSRGMSITAHNTTI